MPSLRSLEIWFVMSVWRSSECCPSAALRAFQNLLTILRLDPLDPSNSHDLLLELEHLTVKFQLDAFRARDELLTSLLNALDVRSERGHLKDVDVVFSTPPGVADFVPSEWGVQMANLRRRSISLKLNQVREEGSGRFEFGEDEESQA